MAVGAHPRGQPGGGGGGRQRVSFRDVGEIELQMLLLLAELAHLGQRLDQRVFLPLELVFEHLNVQTHLVDVVTVGVELFQTHAQPLALVLGLPLLSLELGELQPAFARCALHGERGLRHGG